MSDLYDIYFAAQLIDGFDEANVRTNLQSLFKADAPTLEKLFSGKPQLIKRGVDKAGAIKYKAALQKAGAIALIRKQASAAAPQPTAPVPEEEYPSSSDIKPAGKPAKAAGSMAERIAALAAEPASGSRFDSPSPAAAVANAASSSPAADTEKIASSPVADTAADAFTLAPTGSSVLRDEERVHMEELDIDTSAIHLAENNGNITHVTPPPAPPPPDTEHLSMGAVGEAIPHLESIKVALNPDTSHLSMGEVGEDIPHLESNVVPLNPDTSALQLSPEGSEVLAPADRRKEPVQAPNTDHISLEQPDKP